MRGVRNNIIYLANPGTLLKLCRPLSQPARKLVIFVYVYEVLCKTVVFCCVGVSRACPSYRCPWRSACGSGSSHLTPPAGAAAALQRARAHSVWPRRTGSRAARARLVSRWNRGAATVFNETQQCGHRVGVCRSRQCSTECVVEQEMPTRAQPRSVRTCLSTKVSRVLLWRGPRQGVVQ